VESVLEVDQLGRIHKPTLLLFILNKIFNFQEPTVFVKMDFQETGAKYSTIFAK
jgi:hypothetical protein